MRTVILVPRRSDGGHRDRLWAYARARWERYFPDLAIFEGQHDDGPFNRSAAVNRAAAAAGDWDLAVVIDSDVLLSVSQVRAAIERAGATGKVTWGHRRWRGIREDMAIRLVADRRDLGPELSRDDLDLWVERTNPVSWSCCMVIPRLVWDDMGGFDERFVGWGYEDMAAQSLIVGLYGHERIEGDVIHLWHPRSEDRIVKGQPGTTATKDYNRNARWGRRYMVAARRDHGLHDRLERADVAEMKRDIANLKRDDAIVALRQTPDERRTFEDWWPTLEELRDGAKVYREAQIAKGATVTVVVMSGGTAETWSERSAYLRRSLASLTENVAGPVVQRVVYSGWDESLTPELEAIASEFGFYVAGGGQFGHTGTRKRMWTYLGKRAKGDYIFATEDDFLYPKPVELVPLIEVLRDDPQLAQIALLRDAFYQDERETGGVLGWPEPAFTKVGNNGTSRLEHRLFWTNNPSLFRKSMTERAWPEGKHSETLFGKALLRDDRVRFAFWGDHEEMTRHIGETRAGAGY